MKGGLNYTIQAREAARRWNESGLSRLPNPIFVTIDEDGRMKFDERRK